jgi:hypothetical protein
VGCVYVMEYKCKCKNECVCRGGGGSGSGSLTFSECAWVSVRGNGWKWVSGGIGIRIGKGRSQNYIGRKGRVERRREGRNEQVRCSKVSRCIEDGAFHPTNGQ